MKCVKSSTSVRQVKRSVTDQPVRRTKIRDNQPLTNQARQARKEGRKGRQPVNPVIQTRERPTGDDRTGQEARLQPHATATWDAVACAHMPQLWPQAVRLNLLLQAWGPLFDAPRCTYGVRKSFPSTAPGTWGSTGLFCVAAFHAAQGPSFDAKVGLNVSVDMKAEDMKRIGEIRRE